MHTSEHRQIRLRSLASEYNCMGMVFASRRTSIDVEHMERILQDDGYRRIAPEFVMLGDLIVYRDQHGVAQHVGLVCKHDPDVARAGWNTEVLSQWGHDGEYLHSAGDVPAIYGDAHDFWTDRET